MCYHLFDHVIKDPKFIKKMTNTFLIRNPEKTVLSNYVMNPDITSEEIDIELEYKLFMKVREITGETPIVIDADELEDNPDGVTQAYCDVVDIPFIPDAMHWKVGRHIEEWDSWKEWHVDATESSEFKKIWKPLILVWMTNPTFAITSNTICPFIRRYSLIVSPLIDQIDVRKSL